VLHLGMSGRLRVLPAGAPAEPHTHVRLRLDDGNELRFRDQRRFGMLFVVQSARLAAHPRFRNLGPEPLSPEFSAADLARAARGSQRPIKNFIMDASIVVGVGNIYASEALFRARVHPRRAARRLKRAEIARLVRGIKSVLTTAIRVGGTTLRDYVGADGNPGYFRQRLYVYERAGKPCRVCRTPIRQITQGQRSTYFCPKCQKQAASASSLCQHPADRMRRRPSLTRSPR
jgi:formamidopyrimidine-DNA glycosylase